MTRTRRGATVGRRRVYTAPAPVQLEKSHAATSMRPWLRPSIAAFAIELEQALRMHETHACQCPKDEEGECAIEYAHDSTFGDCYAAMLRTAGEIIHPWTSGDLQRVRHLCRDIALQALYMTRRTALEMERRADAEKTDGGCVPPGRP